MKEERKQKGQRRKEERKKERRQDLQHCILWNGVTKVHWWHNFIKYDIVDLAIDCRCP